MKKNDDNNNFLYHSIIDISYLKKNILFFSQIKNYYSLLSSIFGAK